MKFYNAYVHRCVISNVEYDQKIFYQTVGVDKNSNLQR